MMAAKSLITLYRDQLPALLAKKDRGRQTEGQVEQRCKAYGEVLPLDYVPGAEALLKSAKEIDVKSSKKKGDDSDSDGWVDIDGSGDEFEIPTDSEDDDESGDEVDIKSEDEDDAEDEEGEDDDDEDVDDEEDEDDSADDEEEEVESGDEHEDVKENKASKKSAEAANSSKKEKAVKVKAEVLDEKEAAQTLAATRIFTDEDFKRIDAENIRKFTKNARKRPLEADKSEYIKLNDIEMIFKKRRTDKDSRLESVMRGREDREKFGYRDKRRNIHCSKTNNEKTKKKNFHMMRHKARSKVKKSFKEKQLSMRKHLLKQKRMK